MAAPLPAPRPPPAMAPAAAPTAAPARAPTPASFSVSTVLSRELTCFSACSLHASMADRVGTTAAGGGLAGRAVWGTGAGVCTAASFDAGAPVSGVAVFLLTSGPYQLATTRPVITAVAITRAIPIAVTFQGFQLCCDMAAPARRVVRAR